VPQAFSPVAIVGPSRIAARRRRNLLAPLVGVTVGLLGAAVVLAILFGLVDSGSQDIASIDRQPHVPEQPAQPAGDAGKEPSEGEATSPESDTPPEAAPSTQPESTDDAQMDQDAPADPGETMEPPGRSPPTVDTVTTQDTDSGEAGQLAPPDPGLPDIGMLADSRASGPGRSLSDLLNPPASVISYSPVPVPSVDDQEAARKLVQEVFGEDISNATTAETRSAVVRQLLAAAADRNEEPAARYVVLGEAGKLAIATGDAALVSQVIDRLAQEFDVDRLRVMASAFHATSRQTLGAAARERLLDNVLRLIDESVTHDRYDIAMPLEEIARASTPRLRNRAALERIDAAMEAAKASKEHYDAAQTAARTLEANPDDVEANLVYGTYLCLSKEDWQGGIPLLAKGSNEDLKRVALLELAGAADASAEVQLGDAWYGLASSDDSLDGFSARANHWYSLALPNVSGLTRQKVVSRLGVASEPAAPGLSSLVQQWKPVEANGELTDCHTLGPFRSNAVNDRAVMTYLAKAKPGKMLLGKEPTPAHAHLPNQAQAKAGQSGQTFDGPTMNDSVQYFIFRIRTDIDQQVGVRASTHADAASRNALAVFVNSMPIRNNGAAPLRSGMHSIIVRQHHRGSDDPNRSWVRVSVDGEALVQATVPK